MPLLKELYPMRLPIFPTLVPLALASLLTGCGLNSTSELSQPTAGTAIRGNVHGGQQPVVGAHVYLFAANTTGYAGSGIAPSSNNASISLLNASSTGNSDSLGAYVLTDSDGGFSITGDYTCTANTQVYVYARGGNPGGGSNPNAGFLSVLGNCPASGNFVSTVPFIWMNEVTTVAAAYAMAGYASDATHVSSANISVAKTGLANAFASAANLVNPSTGTALSYTPAGNGIIPFPTINTIADILAACVNTAAITSGSTVTPSSTCSSLFSTATSTATSSGTQPSDTASAAINIVHFPASNVATLFSLMPSNVAFSPAYNSAPAEFLLVVGYVGGGYGGASHLAVDASGDVWAAGTSVLAEFSPTGLALSPSTGFTNSNLVNAGSLAVDLSGNIWALNSASTSLVEFTNSGSYLRSATLLNNGSSLAIDGAGSLWVPNASSEQGYLAKFSSTGTLLANYTGAGLASPLGVAVTTAGNVWVSNSGTGSGLSEFSYSGSPIAATPFNVSGITASSLLAIDSSNNVWAMNGNGTISAMNSVGTPLSGSPFLNGFSGSAVALAVDGQNQVFAINNSTSAGTTTSNLFTLNPSSGNVVNILSSAEISSGGFSDLALDGSGNLWISIPQGLLQIMSVATPVMTPLSSSVQSGCLGKRPCFPPV
jgi:hypothetical protein